MRVDSRLNDRRYDLIFHPQTYATSASMEDLFRRLLGETSADRKKVVIIDLSPVPFDVRNSVISLILRCLFDFAYWYRRVNETSYPIAVFADEAHIYLNDSDSDARSSRESAERIAKEGRKYGISLRSLVKGLARSLPQFFHNAIPSCVCDFPILTIRVT